MINNITLNSFDKIFDLSKTNNGVEAQKTQSFVDFLYKALQNVDNLQKEADYQNELFVMGVTSNPQDAIVASEKASLALSLTLQIRNKVIDAYNEIMRMQV